MYEFASPWLDPGGFKVVYATVQVILKVLDERLEGKVKADTDAEDADAALDYGSR